jgi:hypothetical protein
MNGFLYWVCGKAMWLNRIPRYGRTYRVLVPDDSQPDGGPVLGPAEWGWHWRGYWGINLLQEFNLMWKYFDEYQRRNPGAVTGKDH